MKSAHRFVIQPIGGQYVNTKDVGGHKMIINTSIEHAEDVNRYAKIIHVPYSYKGDLEKGDTVIVHHNVFRTSYSDMGDIRESDFFLKEDNFFCDKDLIFMRFKNGIHEGIDENVFIRPIQESDFWEGDREKSHTGTVVYSNKKLRESGVKEGDLVAFRKNCEYPFEIEGEKLYKMANKRILVKLETINS